MKSLDILYKELLVVGFVLIRKANDARDAEWMTAELEFLHNIPSLIGDENLMRHRYFWDQERNAYIDWVSAPGKEHEKALMETYYEPIFREFDQNIGRTKEWSVDPE